MKKIITFILIACYLNANSQCASNYAGTYSVKGCGSTTQCTATVTVINPNKIMISHFACIPSSVIGCTDTIYADLNCTADTLHAEYVNYNISGGGLTYEGSGLLYIDSLKITYYQTHPGPGSQYICYMYYNFSPLGIQKPNGTNDQLTIYPNPTSDQFYIETSATDKLNVVLYDVNGRQVFNASVMGKSNIDVTTLDNGAYTMTVKTADRVINKKLVILR